MVQDLNNVPHIRQNGNVIVVTYFERHFDTFRCHTQCKNTRCITGSPPRRRSLHIVYLKLYWHIRSSMIIVPVFHAFVIVNWFALWITIRCILMRELEHVCSNICWCQIYRKKLYYMNWIYLVHYCIPNVVYDNTFEGIAYTQSIFLRKEFCTFT